MICNNVVWLWQTDERIPLVGIDAETVEIIIEELKGEIKDLQDTISEVWTVGKSIEQIKNWNKEMTMFYSDIWKGNIAESYLESCESGEFKIAYEGYIANIDEIEDAINWEIYNLNCIINEKYSFLSELINAWNNLCTKIRNYFN